MWPPLICLNSGALVGVADSTALLNTSCCVARLRYWKLLLGTPRRPSSADRARCAADLETPRALSVRSTPALPMNSRMVRRLASDLRTLGMSPAHSRFGLRCRTGALPLPFVSSM